MSYLRVAPMVVLLAACARGAADDPPAGSGVPTEPDGVPDASTGGPIPAARDAGSDSRAPDAGRDATVCGRPVVINELQTAGAAASDEFVELFNPNDCAVALGDWKLHYRSRSNGASAQPLHAFAVGASIAAQSFFLVAAPTLRRGDAELSPGMAEAGGQVGLVDGAGKLVDAVGYGPAAGDYVETNAAPAPPARGSIGRRVDGADSDDNRTDFAAYTTPTPGAPNR